MADEISDVLRVSVASGLETKDYQPDHTQERLEGCSDSDMIRVAHSLTEHTTCCDEDSGLVASMDNSDYEGNGAHGQGSYESDVADHDDGRTGDYSLPVTLNSGRESSQQQGNGSEDNELRSSSAIDVSVSEDTSHHKGTGV